jgi:hypothetical protein
LTPTPESRCRWAHHHLSVSYHVNLGHHSFPLMLLQHTVEQDRGARRVYRLFYPVFKNAVLAADRDGQSDWDEGETDSPEGMPQTCNAVG